MKEVDIKFWEVTKEELQKIAKNYPALRVFIYDLVFKDKKILRADMALLSARWRDDFTILCFDDPSRYIK